MSEANTPIPEPPEMSQTGETLDSLYARFAQPVYLFLLRKVGEPQRAEDLTHEVFLRLDKAIPGFQYRCSWRTYVFVITRKVLAEDRRSRWQHLADRVVDLDESRFAREVMEQVDPDEEALGTLLRQRLIACIRQLSDVARAVIVGHYFEGVTLRELTERLKLAGKSGSRAVLIAAQRRLKKCLTSREEAP